MEEIYDSDKALKSEPLVKKDRSLLYMGLILGGIILIMGYLTLFVDDPWNIFSKNDQQPLILTNTESKLLDKSEDMSDEEVEKSLIKFIEAFYNDLNRGYFDPPSYFATITQTFYNYHRLTHTHLKNVYKNLKKERQDFNSVWQPNTLEFQRNGSQIMATYWTRERYYTPSASEQRSMDAKYEIFIDEHGKIFSFKQLEIRGVSSVKIRRDTTTIDLALMKDMGHVYDYTLVDEVPVFPGGQQDWKKFISSNMRYPAKAEENKIEGKVMVAFVVSKGGFIRDVRVKQGIGGGCDEEAVRIIKASPRWTPGKINGEAVSTYCILPVNFQLSTQ